MVQLQRQVAVMSREIEVRRFCTTLSSRPEAAVLLHTALQLIASMSAQPKAPTLSHKQQGKRYEAARALHIFAHTPYPVHHASSPRVPLPGVLSTVLLI